jgi:hypothetical protein
MNSLFEGTKVPSAAAAVVAPEQLNEVSLNALLKEMTEVELDFLRECLVIDGTVRKSLAELLEHPYFDSDFKSQFEADFPELIKNDKTYSEALTKIEHLTKDGRTEIPTFEIFTDSEMEEDSDDEDDSSGGQ